MKIAMINDDFLPYDELPACYLDRGLYFGDGVYEVLRSYNGKIFALEEHLQRFANSLAGIDIKGIDIKGVKARVLEAFKKSQIPNAKIYFHITRGSAPRDHNCGAEIKPNFFLTVSEIGDYSKTKQNGIAVCTYPDLRWKKCWIKSLNLLPNVLAKMDAARKGCDEAILVGDNGLITEGSSSGFFACLKGKLQTAPLSANILPSITRKYVIKAAQDVGVKVVEKSIRAEVAKKADELFITVTTKDVVPVVKFDDTAVSNGQPGAITKKLIAEFEKFTK